MTRQYFIEQVEHNFDNEWCLMIFGLTKNELLGGKWNMKCEAAYNMWVEAMEYQNEITEGASEVVEEQDDYSWFDDNIKEYGCDLIGCCSGWNCPNYWNCHK